MGAVREVEEVVAKMFQSVRRVRRALSMAPRAEEAVCRQGEIERGILGAVVSGLRW